MRNNLSALLLLLLSGVLLTKGASEVYLRYKTPSTSYTSVQTKPLSKLATAEPIKLSIESINLNSPISSTKDTWVYPENSLVYLQNSAKPGAEGNTVIYGHNFKSLLGNLNDTKLGDKINIQLSNGEVISYTITNKYNVTPDQTHILNPTQDNRLTLFTCSGFLDSKRLVVIAKANL
jgi:LPXTG-site transpeptidase (sortase) family protein